MQGLVEESNSSQQVRQWKTAHAQVQAQMQQQQPSHQAPQSWGGYQSQTAGQGSHSGSLNFNGGSIASIQRPHQILLPSNVQGFGQPLAPTGVTLQPHMAPSHPMASSFLASASSSAPTRNFSMTHPVRVYFQRGDNPGRTQLDTEPVPVIPTADSTLAVQFIHVWRGLQSKFEGEFDRDVSVCYGYGDTLTALGEVTTISQNLLVPCTVHNGRVACFLNLRYTSRHRLYCTMKNALASENYLAEYSHHSEPEKPFDEKEGVRHRRRVNKRRPRNPDGELLNIHEILCEDIPDEIRNKQGDRSRVKKIRDFLAYMEVISRLFAKYGMTLEAKKAIGRLINLSVNRIGELWRLWRAATVTFGDNPQVREIMNNGDASLADLHLALERAGLSKQKRNRHPDTHTPTSPAETVAQELQDLKLRSPSQRTPLSGENTPPMHLDNIETRKQRAMDALNSNADECDEDAWDDNEAETEEGCRFVVKQESSPVSSTPRTPEKFMRPTLERINPFKVSSPVNGTVTQLRADLDNSTMEGVARRAKHSRGDSNDSLYQALREILSPSNKPRRIHRRLGSRDSTQIEYLNPTHPQTRSHATTDSTFAAMEFPEAPEFNPEMGSESFDLTNLAVSSDSMELFIKNLDGEVSQDGAP